jgi:hypothetical protein
MVFREIRCDINAGCVDNFFISQPHNPSLYKEHPKDVPAYLTKCCFLQKSSGAIFWKPDKISVKGFLMWYIVVSHN